MNQNQAISPIPILIQTMVFKRCSTNPGPKDAATLFRLRTVLALISPKTLARRTDYQAHDNNHSQVSHLRRKNILLGRSLVEVKDLVKKPHLLCSWHLTHDVEITTYQARTE